MQVYAVKFIPLLGSLYMFRVFYTPIIRSTIFNCIYSHWYKFYVYGSVHHNIFYEITQQMQLYAVKFITLLGSLYMFRVFYTPIIRSTIYNCIYSHWYKP